MNNGMYTTIPPEPELDHTIMTPEEEFLDYALEFAPVDPVVEDVFTNHEIESKLQKFFNFNGYYVCFTSRPRRDNPLECTYGLETPKIDLEYVTRILDDMNIPYRTKDGAFKNSDGKWTHKSFAFIEIPNHHEAYRTIYNRMDEIPVLVEGDSI